MREFVAVWLVLQRGRVTQGFDHPDPFGLHSGGSLPRPGWGSLQSLALWGWSHRVIHLLDSPSLALSAVHVRGVSIILADGLSRFIPVSTEWTVDTSSFS